MRPGIGQVAIIILAVFALAVVSPAVFPQDQSVAAPAQPYSPAELDQLLAPIALYPDALLGQVLMASTYPLEVVEAARWVEEPAHAPLKGDELVSALEPLPWDPSVKALVPFPAVLLMMNSHLDWIQKLGDAFLAQEADVMNAVQRLRRQALDAGTLVSTPQQTVTVAADGTIIIAPASPEVLYVPAYNPSVVYVPWPYPAYPPYYFPPLPIYYYGTVYADIQFSIGFVIVHTFWGWTYPDWRLRVIVVDASRVNVINRYVISHYHRPPFEGRAWAHDPWHRVGVPYRSPQLRERFQPRLPGSPQKRYEYRGHERPPATGGVPSTPPPAWRRVPGGTPPAPAPRVTPTPRVTPAPRVRPPSPAPRVTPTPAPRVTPPAWRPVAPAPAPIYQRSRNGAEAREFSNRGRESRQSAPAPQPSAPPPSAPPQGGGSWRR